MWHIHNDIVSSCKEKWNHNVCMQINRTGINTLSKVQMDPKYFNLILIYVPRGVSLGHDTWKGT